MKHFVKLFENLDQTTKTNDRIRFIVDYLQEVSESDKIWTVALLAGKRPKRVINSTRMKEWAAEMAGIPMSLFEETYHVVGDMAETIALLIPNDRSDVYKTLSDWMSTIAKLGKLTDEEKKHFITDTWKSTTRQERFLFNKLIGGSFRVGVSQKTMVKSLSLYTGISETELAHRLMGNWNAATDSFDQVILTKDGNEDDSKPYPFYLAYPLEDPQNFEADPTHWIAEYKWDGIRGQLIKRNGEFFIWTRGEELVTEKYPELTEIDGLPDGLVLDGEILPYKDGKPLSFNDLQRRIGRKTVGKKLLQEVPVILIAYDLLEYEGKDLRSIPLEERKKHLKDVVARAASSNLLFSEDVPFENFEQLAKAREKSQESHAEGLMLKRRNSAYQVGRKKGDWWKWKVDPLVIDAVLIYAMRGHGRRANLFTDYTFAVWDGDTLVPFTKAYSGLTDSEFRQVDRFVKANVIEKFGPVWSVQPHLVFEIAFEGIAESKRHKSGIALRFPRMSRWRQDKKAEEANTLQDLTAILKANN